MYHEYSHFLEIRLNSSSKGLKRFLVTIVGIAWALLSTLSGVDLCTFSLVGVCVHSLPWSAGCFKQLPPILFSDSFCETVWGSSPVLVRLVVFSLSSRPRYMFCFMSFSNPNRLTEQELKLPSKDQTMSSQTSTHAG